MIVNRGDHEDRRMAGEVKVKVLQPNGVDAGVRTLADADHLRARRSGALDPGKPIDELAGLPMPRFLWR